MNCFFCGGSMEESVTSHVVTLEKCIIIVKNVPCLKCGQCGETYFEDSVAERLEEIVSTLQTMVTEIAVVEFTRSAA